MVKLLFVGPQGSGKGTQAKIISKLIGIPHISAGDLLRDIKGEKKELIDSFLKRGELVPDEIIGEIIKERIKEADCKKGFILDGFPRNKKQAEILKKITDIDKLIEISISDEEAVKRISSRRICKNCGKIYNLHTEPKPKRDCLCDNCNIPLIKREDDNKEAIEKRLETYHRETEPIIKMFPNLKINGEKKIDEITNEILKQIKSDGF